VNAATETNTRWEAKECMVFLGNDGAISLRNVIDGKRYAKAIAMLPTVVQSLRDCVSKMESVVLRIEGEYGMCRDLNELAKDGDLPKELIAARLVLEQLSGVGR
jgi:hypothetical protein